MKQELSLNQATSNEEVANHEEIYLVDDYQVVAIGSSTDNHDTSDFVLDSASEASMLEEVETDDAFVYYEEHHNCDCCHGHVYNCSGETCSYLGECICIASASAKKIYESSQLPTEN